MDFNFLSATPLFLGMADTEIQSVLSCLGYRERLYKKGEIIFHAGSTVHEIGLVESGSVNVTVNFYWGQSNIFGHIGKGAVFAEHYAAIPDTELLCDIVASEASEILFLDIDKIMSTCRNECVFHKRLIQNLLKISAQKSLALSARMIHIAPKSLRARIQSYLSEQALLSGTSKLQHIAMSSDLNSENGIYTAEMFAAATGNSTDYVNALANDYVGTLSGGVTPDDPFFTRVDYKGAVSASDDWTSGWTL